MTTNKDQAAKADAGKSQPLLLHKDMARALYLVQRILDYGEQKYSRLSWENVEYDRWDDAQRRHGQEIDLQGPLSEDAESGMLHRAHQIAGLIIMLSLDVSKMSISDIKELGQFNPPPQEHKAKPSQSYVRVADAVIGDRVLYKYAIEPSLISSSLLSIGKTYKVKQVGRGQMLVKDDRGIDSWFANHIFYGSKP